MNTKPLCSISDCPRPSRSQGMCKMHYNKEYQRRNALAVGSRVLLHRTLGGYVRITKPEPATVVKVLFEAGTQSLYDVQLDRDRRIGDVWPAHWKDLTRLAE